MSRGDWRFDQSDRVLNYPARDLTSKAERMTCSPEPGPLITRKFSDMSLLMPRSNGGAILWGAGQAAGKLVFRVFGAIAHFERRLISERTGDGIAAARKRGRTPGATAARLSPDTCSAPRKPIEAGCHPLERQGNSGSGGERLT